MKRDGRTLDHATLEEFRLLALRRVKEGEKPSAVVKSLGMNRTSIYRWLRAASGRGKGERALISRPATGRPCKLTASQQAQVFRWINGKGPRQYGLYFGLWTRQIAAMLIEQKFGVQLGVTAVGRMLARLGLTPQKPLQRAYQRDPEAIERWQRETYPEIAAAAKRSAADIYFSDESGFRADTVHGKTWAAKGKTPVIARPGQRQSISAASAVNAKGGFWFGHVSRRTECRAVHRIAQADDEGPQEPRALSGRRTACAQEAQRAAIHRIHQREVDHARSTGLCTGPQSGRTGAELRQAHGAERSACSCSARCSARRRPGSSHGPSNALAAANRLCNVLT